MRCTSCGYDMRNSMVCPSCGYDHRENPIDAPKVASDRHIRKTKSEAQTSRKPSKTGTYRVCGSCEYQLKNSMICPSCGHDNRDRRTAPVIYAPEKDGSESTEGRERIVCVTEDDLLLRKWFTILFWLVIPSIIGSLMSKSESSLALVGYVIIALTSLAYGLILLRLSSVESNYRKAGIFYLVSMGLSFLSVLGITIALVLPILALVISLTALYYEYCGHSFVLAGVDNVLSEDWEQLWKWTIGVYVAMIGGIFLAFISLMLASIVVILAMIGVIIVSIVKIIFLYQTARSF